MPRKLPQLFAPSAYQMGVGKDLFPRRSVCLAFCVDVAARFTTKCRCTTARRHLPSGLPSRSPSAISAVRIVVGSVHHRRRALLRGQKSRDRRRGPRRTIFVGCLGVDQQGKLRAHMRFVGSRGPGVGAAVLRVAEHRSAWLSRYAQSQDDGTYAGIRPSATSRIGADRTPACHRAIARHHTGEGASDRGNGIARVTLRSSERLPKQAAPRVTLHFTSRYNPRPTTKVPLHYGKQLVR